MPDVHIVNDDASFASSDTFSTRDSTEPTRPLARRNTVSQLTRKVSKRISQSILGGGQHHDLSERNLKALEGATVSDRQFHDTKIYDPIHEDIEDECPSVNPEAQREARLHESYATFCQSFTMSGSTRTSRQFDLSMGTETANESEFSQTKQSLAYNTIEPLHSPTSKWPGYITVYSEPGPTADAFPISPSGNINTPTSPSTDCKKNSHDCSRPDTPIYEDNLSRQHANNLETSRHPNYPPPPPQIITPDVYMDMQREERERKAARRQKLLYPFRSWFLSTPPFWTRRYEVAE